MKRIERTNKESKSDEKCKISFLGGVRQILLQDNSDLKIILIEWSSKQIFLVRRKIYLIKKRIDF